MRPSERTFAPRSYYIPAKQLSLDTHLRDEVDLVAKHLAVLSFFSHVVSIHINSTNHKTQTAVSVRNHFSAQFNSLPISASHLGHFIRNGH